MLRGYTNKLTSDFRQRMKEFNRKVLPAFVAGVVLTGTLMSIVFGQGGPAYSGTQDKKAPENRSQATGLGKTSDAVGSEIPPRSSLPCFPGAYYRKVVSSFDSWTGIRGVVKLGEPSVDMNRLRVSDKHPLDNFSVYMGGNAAGQEVDAGLTWEFTRDDHGKRSAMRNAWRPFWRVNSWNSAPDEKQYYWYPGDVVTMEVKVAGPGRLRLTIADAGPEPKRVFGTEFEANGFSPDALKQFKRVNAIDQVGNEGRPIQPTRAKVVGSVWRETFLLRGEAAKATRLPIIAKRFTDMRCPVSSISITADKKAEASGGEAIDIHGTPEKK